MRATVLCVLVLVGATCALHIPSRVSRQSILGIPLPNIGGDDSSSSSSSSAEDPSTLDLASDLSQRLVQDIENVIGKLGSAGLFPFTLGSSLFNTLVDEVTKWLSGIVRPDNTPLDGDVVVLAGDLVHSIAKDAEQIVVSIGFDLFQPIKLKADLLKIIIRDVTQWLKKILPNGGRRSGHSTPPSSRPPHRPTPPPSQQPPSTTAKVVNSRSARAIQISISGDIDIEKLENALANVNFSDVTIAIPRIPDLTKISELPALPGLADATKQARKLLIKALDAGAATVPQAIETALNLAIKSANPSSAIVEIVGTILETYLGVAQTVIALTPAALALLKEAAIISGNAVSTVLSVLSTSVAAGVEALL